MDTWGAHENVTLRIPVDRLLILADTLLRVALMMGLLRIIDAI